MPSAKILEQKKKVVKELHQELESAKSMVFTDYMGLNVAQDTEMRAAFRKEGLEYRVIKNTITTRVFDAMGLEDLKSILVGPTAVAYSAEDPILAPRLVVKYRDEFKKFSLKGGVMDGEIISSEEIEKLASIPALPVLYGRLVSTLLFPISSLAITLNLIAEKAQEAGVENVAELVTGGAAAGEPEAESVEPEAKAEEAAAEEPAADAKAEEDAKAKAEEAAAEEPAADAKAEEDVEAKVEEAPAE